MKTAILILSLAFLSACGRPSLSCSDEEVKALVVDIAANEAAKAFFTDRDDILNYLSFSVESIRDQGRDNDTGACYCAATVEFIPKENSNLVPTSHEITYTVEHIVDQPGEFMVTVEGL